MANLSFLEAINYSNQKVIGIMKEADAKDLKSIAVDETNGTVKFFKTEDASGEPAFTITVADLIKDKYLDTTKTVVVNSFAWSDTTYPGSENPSLDGNPVVVFAVANGSETIYSFASLSALIDVYTGKSTPTAATTVSADNQISVDIKVSAEAGNAVVAKADGLYVPEPVFATEAEIDALPCFAST